LNCQKYSLKEQLGAKSLVKPTWSKKITVLTTFLESSLNFLSNNPEKHYKIWYRREEKRYQSLNCQKHSLKEQSGTKSLVKPLRVRKKIVLTTFLESFLNFLSNNPENITQFSTDRKKSGITV